MYAESLIRRARNLYEEYDFKKPFSSYLKDYFRSHREMGSRDRRETRHLIFNLLRIGINLQSLTFNEGLAISTFLCAEKLTDSEAYIISNFSTLNGEDIQQNLDEKIAIIKSAYPSFKLEYVFSMNNLLSEKINKEDWFKSFLKKPFVWIRIREKYRETVINEFNDKGYEYYDADGMISFSGDIALDKTDSFIKGFFEIQDRSSQEVMNYLSAGSDEYWWDCCAGAGGKSLLLKEIHPSIKIIATDVRKNILEKYTDRMQRAAHNFFITKVHDVSLSQIDSEEKFDGIIADVPCSGSGTWSRSPEWLTINIENRVAQHFVPLQRKIISNAQNSLKAGGSLIYITCSVFKMENEENVQFFIDNFPLKLEKTAYLEGYVAGSDTLFVARFTKI